MKYLVYFLAFYTLSFVSQSVLAKQIDYSELEQHVKELTTVLSLSDVQIKKIQPTIEKSMRKQHKIFESFGIDIHNPDGQQADLGFFDAISLRKKLSRVRSETNKTLEELLSSEQMERFLQFQEERSTKMRQRIRDIRNR